MGWYYLFANSKFLQFFERNRKIIYYSISALLFVMGIVVWLLFPRAEKLPFAEALLLLGILLLNGINYFFKNQLSWLSAQIYLAISPIIAPKLRLQTHQFYDPSSLTGLIFFTLIIFLLLGGWLLVDLKDLPKLQQLIDGHGNDSFLKTLWQIDAAVVTVTFISVTFIFELLRGRETIAAKTFSFVLKKVRYKQILFINLLALLPLGLFTFVDTDGGSYTSLFTALSLLIFSFTIFSTLYLLLRLVKLAEPKEIAEATNEVLGNDIKRNVINEIFDRLATNQLYEVGAKNGFIGFGYDFREELHPVRLKRKNLVVVSDIKIDAISDVVKGLKKIIGDKNKKLVVTKQIGSYIERDNDVVARMHEDDYSVDLERKIGKLFKTKSYKEHDGENIADLFDLVRDQAVSSISRGAKSTLSQSLDNFYLALETIFDSLSAIGARFDFKSAREAFVETRSMTLIQSNIREIISEAIKNKNKDIITDVMYFPVRLMQLAFQKRDHLLFRQGVYLFYNAYLSYKQNYKSDDVLIVDRCWRHLREFSDYQIGSKFNNLMESDDGYQLVKGYITEILLVFQLLIKSSIDFADQKAFDEFLKGFDKVFKYLARDFRNSGHDLSMLEHQLERTRNEEEKKKLREQIVITTRAREIQKEISILKRNIKFGLGAWLLRQTISAQVGNTFGVNNLPKFFSTFSSYKELFEAYFAIDKRQVSDIYGWHWWQTEKLDDEEAHWISDTWLDEFYSILAMKTIDLSTDTSIAAMPLPDDDDYFSSGGLNHVKEKVTNTLNRIKTEKDKYSGMLTDVDLEKIEAIVRAHERGVFLQKVKEEQHVVEATLNPDAVKKFYEKFITAWEENASLRSLFKSKKAFIDRTNIVVRANRKKTFGVNRPEQKELFIAQVNEGFSGFGEQYGSSVGRSEDNFLYGKIVNGISNKKVTRTDEIELELVASLKDFKEQGYHCDVIFVSNWRISEAFNKSSKFTPRWRVPEKSNMKGFMGIYSRIPVIQLPTSPEDRRIVFLDIRKLGRLAQVRVDSTTDTYFHFSIKPIDERKFAWLVQKDPKILLDDKGAQKNRDEVFKMFQKRVHLEAYERFELEIRDGNAGVIMEITDE